MHVWVLARNNLALAPNGLNHDGAERLTRLVGVRLPHNYMIHGDLLILLNGRGRIATIAFKLIRRYAD